MDDNLAWERNMTSFPYHHHHQEIEESFVFGSENIFLNPIQEIQDSGAGDHQMGVSSQYWSQALTVNGFQEGKNVIPTTTTAAAAVESLDCLLSATNSNGDTTPPDGGISVIFSDYKDLFNDDNNNNNNNFSGCSSGGSVTKEAENDVVSRKRSSENQNPPENPKKRSNNNSTTNPPNPKRPRSDPSRPGSSNINFRQAGSSEYSSDEPDSEAIAQMKEMIYRAAAFRPVSFADDDAAAAERPRRKNVRISSDPQTVAARQRRERISERIRVLQKLVPGGNKMDTASMLDEAANYLKFLRSQVKALEQVGQKFDHYVMNSCGNGTTSNARSTSHMFQDRVSISNPNEDHVRVVVGVPFNHNQFPMQTYLGNY